MKTAMQAILIAWALGTGISLAFDPAGPPPKRNVAETLAFVSTVKIPSIRLEDSSVEEAIAVAGGFDIPRSYKVQIAAEELGNLRGKKITLVAKDISILQAVSKIADLIPADIRIEPGKIHLIPRRVIAVPAKVPAPDSAKPDQ